MRMCDGFERRKGTYTAACANDIMSASDTISQCPGGVNGRRELMDGYAQKKVSTGISKLIEGGVLSGMNGLQTTCYTFTYSFPAHTQTRNAALFDIGRILMPIKRENEVHELS